MGKCLSKKEGKSKEAKEDGESAKPEERPEDGAAVAAALETAETRSHSKRTRTTTEKFTKDGKVYTKTIVEETTVDADGQEHTTRNETVTEADLESIVPTIEPAESLDQFTTSVVLAHNDIRRKHGASSLDNNAELNELAQKLADEMSETNVLKHSNATYKDEPLGENVATKWSSAGADYTGEEVVQQWYSELEKYDFDTHEFSGDSGHFSQVVWKGSEQIGVGRAFGKDGRVFVVCNYFPAGNVRGLFADNVEKAS